MDYKAAVVTATPPCKIRDKTWLSNLAPCIYYYMEDPKKFNKKTQQNKRHKDWKKNK